MVVRSGKRFAKQLRRRNNGASTVGNDISRIYITLRDNASQHLILRQDTQDSNESEDRLESLPTFKNTGKEKNIMWKHVRLQIRAIQVFNEILCERKQRCQETPEPIFNAAETRKKLKMKEAANRTKSILHLLQSITPNEISASGGQNHLANQKQVFIILQLLHALIQMKINLISIVCKFHILTSHSGSISFRHCFGCLREAYRR